MGDKKFRSVGQCILGLEAKQFSASPRRRGQPAGFRKELKLMRVGRGMGVPRLSKLAWGELAQVEGGEGTFRVLVRTVSRPCRTAVTIRLRVTLGRPLLSLSSELTLAPSEEIQADL